MLDKGNNMVFIRNPINMSKRQRTIFQIQYSFLTLFQHWNKMMHRIIPSRKIGKSNLEYPFMRRKNHLHSLPLHVLTKDRPERFMPLNHLLICLLQHIKTKSTFQSEMQGYIVCCSCITILAKYPQPLLCGRQWVAVIFRCFWNVFHFDNWR